MAGRLFISDSIPFLWSGFLPAGEPESPPRCGEDVYKRQVDDDEINCLGIKKWIENMNITAVKQIEVAYSAESALAYAKLHRINVLITDIQMGSMNGLDLIERVKEYSPNVVSLVITAYARFPYAHRAIKLGVKNFLLKPFGKEELKDVYKRQV